MTKYSSDFLQTLSQRGFLHQCTDATTLDALLARERVTAYIGFDCTAPTLHVGSLIQIMVLRWLQKTGHKPIALIGGGTTKIGDPSGKDETRKVLTQDDIARNAAGIQATLSQFLTFGRAGTDAKLLDNAEWLESLNYIDFLREVGRHFSVNRMLTQDSVRLRLEREQNLSFLEFNYMVLQAYDFTALHERHGCRLQIGGSDQWGNIIMGVELNRRMLADKSFRPMALPEGTQVVEVQPMIRSSGHDAGEYSENHFMQAMQGEDSRLFGLTTPLLTTSSGAKMGKTASGAVWLSPDYLTPYEYWQFWRNTEDADVGRFLRLFTELPMDEIHRLEALQGAEVNEAKKVLANEATRLCHGERAMKAAADTARKAFEEGILAESLPEFTLSPAQVGKGIFAYELFRLSGLCDSGGDAKRLIRGGGAKINDRKVVNEQELVTLEQFTDGALKLGAGKKKLMRVVIG